MTREMDFCPVVPIAHCVETEQEKQKQVCEDANNFTCEVSMQTLMITGCFCSKGMFMKQMVPIFSSDRMCHNQSCCKTHLWRGRASITGILELFENYVLQILSFRLCLLDKKILNC